MKFRVTIQGKRGRVFEAPSALDAAIAACNSTGVRYAETRLKIEPVNRASIFRGHTVDRKGDVKCLI